MAMLEKVRLSSWQAGKTAADVEIWYEWIIDILEHRELLTIYDAEGQENEEDAYLDAAILKALFKSTASQTSGDRGLGELKLALALNRMDMIKGIIFNSDSSTGSGRGLTSEDYGYLLPFALQKDRVEFVKEFLIRGLIIKDYLTPNRLSQLYNKFVSAYLSF